jgi:hypothetical protein
MAPHLHRHALSKGTAMTFDASKVLMIYPRFNPKSFWGYEGACELLGARYPATPLGMINKTVAPLLNPAVLSHRR